MFDPKSDYALNKMDPEAIVYPDPRGDKLHSGGVKRLPAYRGHRTSGGGAHSRIGSLGSANL